MGSKCLGQKEHRVFLFPGSWPEQVSALSNFCTGGGICAERGDGADVDKC